MLRVSREVSHRDPAWDELVCEFDTGCLFHTSGWLEYLERTQGVEVVTREFSHGEGYHVAALTKRGPFRLAGSPLPGWRTMHMGPLVGNGSDGDALAAECERFGVSLGVSLYELVSPTVAREPFERAGWQTEAYGTLVVDLPGDLDALWSGLKKAVRGRVKKGRKNGLEVRLGLDGSLVRDVWVRSDSIMRHKGLQLDWDEPHGRALEAALAPRDQLLGVRIVAPSGHTAACGLFPYDHRTVYYWAGASFAEDRALVPSELMHWAVMEWAVEHGLRCYDMYGSGDYKLKYGAEFRAHARAMRFYNPAARAARAAYAHALALRERLKLPSRGRRATWD
jgi:hypothetical protein